jgi:hemoglobin
MRRGFAAVMMLVLTAGHAIAGGTLYASLGKKEGIERIVGRTIDLSLVDERIGKTFDNTNIARIKKLLTDQICVLTGGPCTYTGRDMRKSHAHLKLRNFHFNALVENLQTAMDESEIPFATQNELLAILAPMQRDITAPPSDETK